MKSTKAFIATALALVLLVSLTACTSRNDNTSSSSLPSPSAPAASSMAPSSSEPDDLMSDLEDGISDAASNLASTVTTMSTDFDKIGALGSGQVKWGPGVLVDEHNRTAEPQLHQEEYGRYGAYFIAPEDCGKFYLTFDEGYENGYTPQILDTLKEKNVSAVFFVTLPFVKSSPDLVRRMIDEGHIVGNHTNRHLNPTAVSLAEAKSDIVELHDYMLENFDYEMSLYRPPEGAFSEQTLAMAQQMGYTTVLWSFAYKDWDPKNQPGVDAARERTHKFIHEGAIYLLHAVSHDNAEILGELIDEVRARGLELSKWDLPYVAPEDDAVTSSQSSSDD